MTASFVHPTALVETEDIGRGTRIWAYAHILAGAVVGSDCNVGDGAFIESGATIGDRVTIKNHALIWHGVAIEDDVFIGPSVVFTNDLNPRVEFKKGPSEWSTTKVEVGASIGANATILCGIVIGRYALVGAGALVIRDVPPHGLVVGNPANLLGWACRCGRRLGEDLRCQCGRSYGKDSGGLILRGTSRAESSGV